MATKRNYKIKADFIWSDNKYELRENTKIIFNNNESNCIGIVLMLNPGSAKPLDNKIIETVKNCLSKSDSTLGKVAKWVGIAYKNKQVEKLGYIEIINLIDNIESNSENLNKINIDFKERLDIIKKKIDGLSQKINWIWIAYGKTIPQLNELRRNILMNIDKEKIVGISDNIFYMHPISISINGKNGKIEELIKQIEEKI